MSLSGGAQIHKQNQLFEHISDFVKVKNIFPALATKSKILDVGCGDARLSQKLVEMGHEVTGLDVNQEGLKIAQTKGLKTILGDIEQSWLIENKTFDLIMMLDVLEHITNMEGVLAEVKRVLKPDGYFLLVFPNHFDLRNRLNMLFGGGIVHWDHKKYKNTKAWNYGHVRFLKLDEIKEFLSLSGFEVDKIQLNFMGGGIIPSRFTPKFLRKFLVKSFPELFSGKFAYLCSLKDKNKVKVANTEYVILDKTPLGL